MEEKKLVRSRDRWLAGICGGIAEYMGWPKDNVRLGWLLLTLFTAFSGLLIYLILWIVMPEQKNGSNIVNNSNNNYNKV
jgi:phage shock protein PspC (stress-responsive transcriptional regulator)